MSGCVGVIASEFGRATIFPVCLTSLRLPVNTHIEWAMGSDRSIGRNSIVKTALGYGAEWVLFLDDDHAFPHDHLMKLLRWDEPIVASLYIQRGAPFAPVAYIDRLEDGTYVPPYLPECPGEGLLSVVGAGTGGMLIRSEVFHALEPTYGQEWFTHTTEKSEDLMFCDRAIEAGFPVYLDLGARMGHVAPAAVWPYHPEGDGEWKVGFTFSETASLWMDFPPLEDEPVEE